MKQEKNRIIESFKGIAEKEQGRGLCECVERTLEFLPPDESTVFFNPLNKQDLCDVLNMLHV